MRIFGFNESEHENTPSVTMDLLQNKMGLDIQESDIDRVHRVGRKGVSDKIRPIIVNFTSYRVRGIVFRAKSRLKSERTKSIYINEDLTKARSELFFKARQLKRDKRISDCWTFDGRILVKNNHGAVTSITSPEDLQKVVGS